ncbi:hypothetical protein [Streptomyces anulatus]|uniref:hypothetical protein n=1 Tax=Streptomyces anulatus TaxID=1892 RepID=UPI001C279D9F|nr:hypothetical protein [Streptomyces anulatus]
MSRQRPQLACGTITAGRLSLYRVDENGQRVQMTEGEIANAVKDTRRRRRRLFTEPPPPSELALLLGHDAEAAPGG